MTAATQPAEPVDDASALCLDCALCCTGELFSHVPVDPSQLERMHALGMTTGSADGRPHFRQPCPQNLDARCAIYADRPGQCRSFRCELLKRLDSGAVTLAEARGHVATAKAMADRVATLSPAARQASARRALRAAGAPAPGEARLWLEAVALDTFLDRHFRKHSAIVWPDDAPDPLAKDAP